MYPEDAHHETIGNILREAALYSALVAVGGSWVTFVRETVLIIMPGAGVGAEALAVVTTTGFGILVAVVVAQSWTCLNSKQKHDVEVVSPVLCDTAVAATRRDVQELARPLPAPPPLPRHFRDHRKRGITSRTMDRRIRGKSSRQSG